MQNVINFDITSLRKSALALPASNTINAYSLVAATVKRVIVPVGANVVKLSGTGDFYVRWNATLDAAVPAADVIDGSAAERNPTGAQLRGLVSYSIIAPVGCVVTASYYG